MDVTCPQCSTRYEFDEALVSNKGTTVKCTSCSRQFRVYRPRGSRNFSGWTIRTTSGQELHYAAMRELQGAILNGEVSTEDVLIPNDGSEPKRLGKIEELRSFFVRRSERETTPRHASSHPPQAKKSKPAKSSQRNADTLKPPPSLGRSSQPAVAVPKGGKLPDDLSADTAAAALVPGTTENGQQDLQTTAQGLGPEDGWRETHKRRRSAPGGQGPKPAKSLNERVTRRRGEHLPPAPQQSEAASASASQAPSHEELQDGDFDIAGSSAGELSAPGESSPEASSAEDRVADPGSWGVTDDSKVSDETDSDDNEDNTATQKRAVDEGTAATAARTTSAPPPAAEEDDDAQDRESAVSVEPATPSPSVARPSVLRQSEPYTDPRFSGYGYANSPRPTFPRVIIGLIALGIVALISYTLVRRNAGPTSQATPTATASSDARVARWVEAGDKLLLAGDIDGAKEQYLKASALRERDPRIATARARVAVVLADLDWLRLRLAPADSEARSEAEATLGRRTKRLEALIKQLRANNGSQAAIARFSLDLQRLRGNASEARKHVKDLNRSEPEATRAMALLELLSAEPDFKTATERLRTAARSEQKLGRAQSALVYALARAGKKKEAGEELEELRRRAPHHTLLKRLQRFVEQAKQAPKDSEKDAPKADSTDKKKDSKRTNNYRTALKQAAAARRAGDLDAAERLYQRALDLDPGNSEAMAGLAAVAKARGNSETATSRYQAMLSKNPSYIPAKLGLADLKLSQGDTAGALALYRQVISAAPGTSYAEQAQRSIARALKQAQAKPEPTPQPATTSTPANTATATATAKTPPAPAPQGSAPSSPKPAPKPATPPKPSPTPQPPPPPPIDTTDLPE